MSGAEKQKCYREKKFKQGLCVQCGGNRIFKAKRCKICYNKTLQDTKRKRDERYTVGLCINCGKFAYEDNKKRCPQCLKKQREWYKNSNYREENRKKDKIRRVNRKEKIIKNYGGKCVCCGEDEPIFLTIDHINEDGARHREELIGEKIVRGKGHTATSTQFYKWLEKNNFPKDNFQLLCMNCNFGKHRNGGICPHQQDKCNYDPFSDKPKHEGKLKD